VATLTADTVWGALHGLETFAQLVEHSSEQRGGGGGGGGLVINWTPLKIQDSPRYPWRGLMIDSARHFLTVPLLERTVDTMAAMKLNVLHWHIVDAESFPYVSEKYPTLQSQASYHPSATYSHDTIRHLVAYARDRGVRVVPEFDTPGHTASVGQAYPDLIADCYDWLKSTNDGDLRWPMFNNVALDVTKSATKVFVQDIVEEMSSLFRDDFFHIGGDEVDQDCWGAVPSILSWMQQNQFAAYNASSDEWVYDFTELQGSWATFAQVYLALF
jgi:hexosaminidase